MGNEYIDDFFEKIYNHELEQKRHLDSGDSLLIGIVAALMGVGAYYLSLIPVSSWCVSCVLFWVFAIGFFVALVGALLCCMASVGILWSQYMSYIASPKDWGTFVDGLTTYHGNYQKGDGIEERAAIDLAPARRQQYIKAGESNRALIISKHGFQVRAKYCIAAAVTLMMLSAIPSSVMQIAAAPAKKSNPPKAGPAKREPPQLKAGANVSTDNTSATEQQKPPAPVKPKPPEIVVVREGDTKPKGK